jgi:hypothetical protein
MNLLDIRKKVVGISGRYDLIVDSVDWADFGMDYYIQSGQRYLERSLGVTPATAKLFQSVAAGAFLASFRNCRSVQELWVMDENSRTKVGRVTEPDMKMMFPRYSNNIYSENPTLITSGRPTYYVPVNLRRSPVEENPTTGDAPSLSSYLDTVSPADPSMNGVLFMPPTDKVYTIEVVGLFYDATLTSNMDENYWTINHPDILVRAALRELAIDFAGSKTVVEWTRTIGEYLLGIEKDAIDQEISEITEMEG